MTDLSSTAPCGGTADAELGDLGDAPDSSNHFSVPMSAYPSVAGLFPSVWDISTGAPPGPFHRDSGDSWLGAAVTEEADADLLPDSDGITNIDPPLDAADRDLADDGVAFPVSLPQCQLTQVTYKINVGGGQTARYTNLWFDFNHNGLWGDQIPCTYGGQPYTVDEWAVQNQVTNLGTGTHVISTPSFRGMAAEEDLWMRISLSETAAPAADGSGYEGGYEIGETEDYWIFDHGAEQYAP